MSANDIRWGDLNRQVLQCSKKGDWNRVLRAYEEMIKILKEEGRDYSHIEESIEKIKQMFMSKAPKSNLKSGCLFFIIIVLAFLLTVLFVSLFIVK